MILYYDEYTLSDIEEGIKDLSAAIRMVEHGLESGSGAIRRGTSGRGDRYDRQSEQALQALRGALSTLREELHVETLNIKGMNISERG